MPNAHNQVWDYLALFYNKYRYLFSFRQHSVIPPDTHLSPRASDHPSYFHEVSNPHELWSMVGLQVLDPSKQVYMYLCQTRSTLKSPDVPSLDQNVGQPYVHRVHIFQLHDCNGNAFCHSAPMFHSNNHCLTICLVPIVPVNISWALM